MSGVQMVRIKKASRKSRSGNPFISPPAVIGTILLLSVLLFAYIVLVSQQVRTEQENEHKLPFSEEERARLGDERARKRRHRHGGHGGEGGGWHEGEHLQQQHHIPADLGGATKKKRNRGGHERLMTEAEEGRRGHANKERRKHHHGGHHGMKEQQGHNNNNEGKGSTMFANALSAKRVLNEAKPYILYGTAWKKDQTTKLVSQAVHAGFRFIDTACQPKHYNEAGVGDGWTMAASELNLDRSDFYLQTKFTSLDGQDPKNVPYDTNADLVKQVTQSLTKSLTNLQTNYLDCLVLHSPMRSHSDTMTVWKTFESFVEEDKVLNLGISNCYDINKFRRLYDEATIKPSILQNRFYSDSNFDTELRTFCHEKGVTYQSFWTLSANRKALASQEWKAVAKEKGISPQTLMYAFMMTLGHTPLSGTTDVGHMGEDVEIMERMQGGEEIVGDEEVGRLAKILGMPAL